MSYCLASRDIQGALCTAMKPDSSADDKIFSEACQTDNTRVYDCMKQNATKKNEKDLSNHLINTHGIVTGWQIYTESAASRSIKELLILTE